MTAPGAMDVMAGGEAKRSILPIAYDAGVILIAWPPPGAIRTLRTSPRRTVRSSLIVFFGNWAVSGASA